MSTDGLSTIDVDCHCLRLMLSADSVDSYDQSFILLYSNTAVSQLYPLKELPVTMKLAGCELLQLVLVHCCLGKICCFFAFSCIQCFNMYNSMQKLDH